MSKTKTFLLFFLLLLPALGWSQKAFKADYEPGVVVFKLKPSSNEKYNNRSSTLSISGSVAEKLSKKVGAKKLVQPFAKQNNGKNRIHVQKQVSSSLDGIFKLELPEGMSVEDAVNMLKLQPEVQYAEPYFLPQLLETPNDANLGRQTYLPVVKAAEAWGIQKGKREIVIAILDTGIDFNHKDLKDNLYYNENDPVDGIDNDADGYVDNYRGWDFANNDNNPTADFSNHGTLVTGVCSATTNNTLGVAGTGYNTRYMPLKIFSSTNGYFRGGYEAIVYAANMGCQVINLSWGASNMVSQYVQDIINYAVLEKDAVVIAAAGNSGKEEDFYPASYNHVLSVSATENSDKKSSWSTWSRFVDMVAPGVVYTTNNGGGYVSTNGTSFSAPMVAGAAALVRAQFPELTAKQVMERIRRSADDIYPVGSNINFLYRIGKGRLNMYNALQPAVGPAVRMDKFSYNNGLGSYAFHSDTIQMWMDFTNYLDPSSDVSVKLVSESSWATILDAEVAVGSFQTMETKSNQQKPFRFALSKDLPSLTLIPFRLEFTNADGYKDYQYFTLRTSGEYIDFKVDDLTLTIASNGNLGYNYDFNLQGLGLRYQDAPLAHNMGLIIAQKPKAVANNIIKTVDPARRDQDFKTTERLRLYNHPLADMDARSSFEVVVKDSTQLNMLINQRILGWSSAAEAAAVVLEYRLVNRADTAYHNLHTGLFGDFNLYDFFLNKAKWDAENLLSYTYDQTSSRYAGYALITSQKPLNHALDISNREGNTAEIGNLISRKQKWGFVSKGVNKTEAGANGSGNDVAQWLGGTMAALQPKTSQKIAFVLVTAPSLEALQAATREARSKYEQYRADVPVLANLSGCEGAAMEVWPKAGSTYRFYSSKEALVVAAEGEKISLPALYKDTVIYVENMDAGWPAELQRINIKVDKISASLSMSADSLLLNAGLEEQVSFGFSSPEALRWQWDFGNGSISDEQNPVVTFTQAGEYLVKLSLTNAAGCTKIFSRKLVVLRKEDVPSILEQKVCLQQQVSISEASGRSFNLYSDVAGTQLLYSGTSWLSEALSNNLTLYASAGSGLTESALVPVQVGVYKADISITHAPELNDTENRFALKLHAQLTSAEQVAQISWYVEQELKGTGENISLPYDATATSLSIRLVIGFVGGCEQELKQTLPLTVAGKPQMDDLLVCRGETPLIQPPADGLYYFYADAQLQQLLHKGSAYQMPVVESNQVLYITNLSGGLESEALALNIRIPAGLAAFNMPGDKLSFDSKNPLNFAANSSDAISWEWDFGDGNSSTLQQPAHLYTKPGTYLVKLTVTNVRGCRETSEKSLELRAAQLAKSKGGLPLPLYPNPSQGEVNLELPASLEANAYIIVLDASGRQLIKKEAGSQKILKLDLHNYNKGLYIVRLFSGDEVWQGRVIHQ